MDNAKVVILILGKQNSGKSTTWYEFFERDVRTGWKKFHVLHNKIKFFNSKSSLKENPEAIEVNVFLRNASFEEYKDDISKSKDLAKLPKMVFCSVQYSQEGFKTINWFKENGYYLYIQWLNPGFKDKTAYTDDLNFKKIGEFGEFHKVSGKEKSNRTSEIQKFVVNWVLKNKK